MERKMQTKQQQRQQLKNDIAEFLSAGNIITVCASRAVRIVHRTSKHLGKSDSASARATGRYNHG